MKKALILALSVFHVFSVWAGAGTRFREAVHSLDLTQPAADELQKVDSKEFEQLTNPYRYLPELAIFPSGYMNHDQEKFSRNRTQKDLAQACGEMFKDAPRELKLKCGGLCTYDDNQNFSFVVKGKYTKAEYKHNPHTFSMSVTKKLQAYGETDEGILVLLRSDDTIEAHEFFNRTMFTELSLAQLVVLANLYDISVSTKNGKVACIHQSWYEVYETIPQAVKDFMFKVSTCPRNDIEVLSTHGIPPLEDAYDDVPPLENAPMELDSANSQVLSQKNVPQKASVLGYRRKGKDWNPEVPNSKLAKTS